MVTTVIISLLLLASRPEDAVRTRPTANDDQHYGTGPGEGFFQKLSVSTDITGCRELDTFLALTRAING